jgi:hypothetical protein
MDIPLAMQGKRPTFNFFALDAADGNFSRREWHVTFRDAFVTLGMLHETKINFGYRKITTRERANFCSDLPLLF